MLTELRVNSLGIIDNLIWEPGPGLNIITGETGSGKSLIIDAIEALFFGEASESMVRHGCSKALVEGYFSLDENTPKPLKDLLYDKNFDAEEETIIASLEIKKKGRNYYRINGNPVAKSLLEHIGRLIIDVHAQSQHLSLFNKHNHIDLLDAYAGTSNMRLEFATRLSELQNLEQRKSEREKQTEEFYKKRDFLNFQLNELTAASIKPGEDVQLESERQKLASAEEIKALALELYEMLRGGSSENDLSAFDRINEAWVTARRLASFDEEVAQLMNDIEEIKDRLDVLGYSVRRYGENIETSQNRLADVQERLDLINDLKRKYGKSIDSILAYKDELEREIEELNCFETDRELIEEKIKVLKQEMGSIGIKLSESRKIAAKQLEDAVALELEELNMPQVVFKVGIKQEEADVNGLPVGKGTKTGYNRNGIDQLEFAASTNPGEPVEPIRNIASTGELSRFTLAIKNALSHADRTSTLIFDEIDIGVGGRSGEVLGRKLWSLARHHQVICITHLPQLAVYADRHFKVTKIDSGGRNTSFINQLSEESRLEELAIMLSSNKYSEKARQAAKDLADRTVEWKNSLQQWPTT